MLTRNLVGITCCGVALSLSLYSAGTGFSFTIR